ncbi:unnamed protein product [Paramecium pentaurelia]|uniref:Uncharacterized protein n=1 Tax=Paramecium pentaurelia TaxID=43138 RepID=A0A8S1RWV8_9CILI|nr:unnamed protein product [Paramecium pentaurelia]
MIGIVYEKAPMISQIKQQTLTTQLKQKLFDIQKQKELNQDYLKSKQPQ